MTEKIGQLMYDDINDQPNTLEIVLTDFSHQVANIDHPSLRRWLSNPILFTGCGTTYALGLCAAAIFQQHGFSATTLPASEISFYPHSVHSECSTLIAFSRSGETSETIWAVESFRQRQPEAKVIAITGSPKSSLASCADLVLGTAALKDKSIIETKSFTSMLLIAQAFVSYLTDDPLMLTRISSIPEKMRKNLHPMGNLAERYGRNKEIDRFFFLGGGVFYGAASHASFTMKESCADWAEAFHPLEFRHGPRTAAGKSALVCSFLSSIPQVFCEEIRVLKEMKSQGAHTLAIYDKNPESLPPVDGAEENLILASELMDDEQISLFLPFVQWLAYFRALAKGQDPDHPKNLQAVTRL